MSLLRPLLSRGVLLVALLASACLPSEGGKPRPLPESVQDLPLREVPAAQPGKVMALVMSGDGNWAHFIAQLSDTLAARGVSVVGLESRAYLSHPRTPEETAQDMTRVIRAYLRRWGADSVLVVGFSRGADFAPFVVNRLPPEVRDRVVAVGLFSPSKMASFEFHLIDLVHYKHRDTDLDAVPEVDSLSPTPVLCVYGIKDKSTLCPLLPTGLAHVVARDAGHRLHAPGELADTLLAFGLGETLRDHGAP